MYCSMVMVDISTLGSCPYGFPTQTLLLPTLHLSALTYAGKVTCRSIPQLLLACKWQQHYIVWLICDLNSKWVNSDASKEPNNK